ncbi:hypothetical protein F4805DRAFT_469744 [Annulohypoxylon moriforme]|nr:hypothetical protein F4805DRAFT_469744 [Annulohypoxylon moriforme]
MPTSTKANRHIVVAGDVPVDLFVYPAARSNSVQFDRRRSQIHRSSGGAALIGSFLNDSTEQHQHQIHWPAPTNQHKYMLNGINAITELDVVSVDKEDITFKVSRRQRLETVPQWQSPDFEPKVINDLDILVLQDADCDFANPDLAINLLRQVRLGFLVYHMARRPLSTGAIWDTVRRGPLDAEGKPRPEDLVVVVSADDLRAEGIELSYGLSWEKTCEDFVEKIGTNGKLDTLVTCANLIVLFGCDAAIYHRGRQMTEPTLVFDPLTTEGSFTRRNLGDLPGLIETFIGGFVTFIGGKTTNQPVIFVQDFVDGIQYGMKTMRRFAKLGFKSETADRPSMYPRATDMIESRLSDDLLTTFTIPSETIARTSHLTGSKWSILHHCIGDSVQIAHNIVRFGALSAASQMPVAQFGDLIVLDRSEIESFRTIFHAVREYLSGQQTRPLNIGVFGSRGSGKSFAAVQVVKAAAASCNRDIRQLRFNLGQLSSVEALWTAFDAVRECVLSGILPLVYINGFDTELQGVQLGWLIHLLLPMHVGQAFDRGEMRHIGAAVFLLGSSTALSIEKFRENECGDTGENPIVQEFLSCLDGYVNVIGIDQVDDGDTMFPVRRAVVLRSLLEEREPKLQGINGISIDESVLSGLLMIPHFRYGIRSLRSIISTSKVTGKSHFEKGALPPIAQLYLHLDFEDFLKYSEGNILSDSVREHMAMAIHKNYIKCRERMIKNEKQTELKVDKALVPWNSLDEEFKESTRAHVDDIPRKLRIISCYLARTGGHWDVVRAFKHEEVEQLAIEEHERWNAERLSKQWRLGEREPEKRSSPFLVPWKDLDKIWQDVDRDLVRSYPSILPPGYSIYRTMLPQPGPATS